MKYRRKHFADMSLYELRRLRSAMAEHYDHEEQHFIGTDAEFDRLVTDNTRLMDDVDERIAKLETATND